MKRKIDTQFNYKLFGKVLIAISVISAFSFLPEIFAQSVVKQPVSEASATIKKYSYTYILSQTKKKEIEYIIVKDSQGNIKTCFNACDVCYPYDKGYSQKGSLLRCNNCGKTFPIDSIGFSNIGTGSCWPGYLEHSMENEDDMVVLQVDSLLLGAYLFPEEPYTDVQDLQNDNSNTNIMVNQNDILVKLPYAAERNYKIISIDGNICKTLSSASGEVSIDIMELTSGVYFLSIEESGKIITKKFNIVR